MEENSSVLYLDLISQSKDMAFITSPRFAIRKIGQELKFLRDDSLYYGKSFFYKDFTFRLPFNFSFKQLDTKPAFSIKKADKCFHISTKVKDKDDRIARQIYFHNLIQQLIKDYGIISKIVMPVQWELTDKDIKALGEDIKYSLHLLKIDCEIEFIPCGMAIAADWIYRGDKAKGKEILFIEDNSTYLYSVEVEKGKAGKKDKKVSAKCKLDLPFGANQIFEIAFEWFKEECLDKSCTIEELRPQAREVLTSKQLMVLENIFKSCLKEISGNFDVAIFFDALFQSVYGKDFKFIFCGDKQGELKKYIKDTLSKAYKGEIDKLKKELGSNKSIEFSFYPQFFRKILLEIIGVEEDKPTELLNANDLMIEGCDYYAENVGKIDFVEKDEGRKSLCDQALKTINLDDKFFDTYQETQQMVKKYVAELCIGEITNCFESYELVANNVLQNKKILDKIVNLKKELVGEGNDLYIRRPSIAEMYPVCKKVCNYFESFKMAIRQLKKDGTNEVQFVKKLGKRIIVFSEVIGDEKYVEADFDDWLCRCCKSDKFFSFACLPPQLQMSMLNIQLLKSSDTRVDYINTKSA